MKKLYKYLLLTTIAASTFFYSCETLELEILESPNSLAFGQEDADLLLNSIQLAYNANMVAFNDNSSSLARIDYMFGRNYFENFNQETLNGIWNRFYSNEGETGNNDARFRGMSVNLAAIEAADAANPNVDLRFHIGIGKIMQAHTLMQIVDFLGDVPWSETNQPVDFPTPNADDDAAVYAAANVVLDEGIAIISALTDNDVPGSTIDFFYDKDLDNWVKFGNTIKMRSALTTGDFAAFNAVVSGGNFITDTAEDMQFSYGTQELQPDTRHQDYAADYRSDGANIYQSNWLMQLMRLTNDPRIRYYFYRQNECTPGASCDPAGNGETLQCSLQLTPTHLIGTPSEDIWCYMEDGYWGRLHGNDEGTPPDNFTRTASGVYPAGGLFDDDDFASVGLGLGGGGAGIEPIMLASYVDFMRAEVALASGQDSDAADFIRAGLEKSIAKVMSFGSLDPGANSTFFPEDTDVEAFIDARINTFDAADMDGKWNILAEQYFVTMYGGGSDAYNFYRRTGYPTTVSPSIDPSPGVFPRTFLYPGVEVIANPNIQQRQDNNTQVFWDTQPAGPAFPSAN